MGLDALLIWWPVPKGLVIVYFLCKQEAPTSYCYWLKDKCLQGNLLQDSWNLINESWPDIWTGSAIGLQASKFPNLVIIVAMAFKLYDF